MKAVIPHLRSVRGIPLGLHTTDFGGFIVYSPHHIVVVELFAAVFLRRSIYQPRIIAKGKCKTYVARLLCKAANSLGLRYRTYNELFFIYNPSEIDVEEKATQSLVDTARTALSTAQVKAANVDVATKAALRAETAVTSAPKFSDAPFNVGSPVFTPRRQPGGVQRAGAKIRRTLLMTWPPVSSLHTP